MPASGKEIHACGRVLYSYVVNMEDEVKVDDDKSPDPVNIPLSNDNIEQVFEYFYFYDGEFCFWNQAGGKRIDTILKEIPINVVP